VARQIRRQDHHAVERLEPLQKESDLDVGVAVMSVLHLAPLAEQSVGLIEKKDRGAVAGERKDAIEVLLGLADVLADDSGEVDAPEIESGFAREHGGAHRFPCAWASAEERGDAGSAREAPLRENPLAMADGAAKPAKLGEACERQHEVLPALFGRNPLREAAKLDASLTPRRGDERIGPDDCGFAGLEAEIQPHALHSRLDLPRRKPETLRRLGERGRLGQK